MLNGDGFDVDFLDAKVVKKERRRKKALEVIPEVSYRKIKPSNLTVLREDIAKSNRALKRVGEALGGRSSNVLEGYKESERRVRGMNEVLGFTFFKRKER